MNIEEMVTEFQELELDPSKLDGKVIYQKVLAIKESIDLSSSARCKHADSVIASLFQVIAAKAARCRWWEDVLFQELKHLRAKIKIATHSDDLTKDQILDLVEVNPEVQTLAKRQAVAEASRRYWEYMLEALKEAGKRIDSAGMLNAVEARQNPVGAG
jgi:hypothetical protein